MPGYPSWKRRSPEEARHSYAAVCLEGAIILLVCIIFTVIAKANPSFDEELSAAMVWDYIGQVVFNMLARVSIHILVFRMMILKC